MKINVGIDEKIKEQDIERLVTLGADEFFCGIMTDAWVDNYGSQMSTNRRTSPVEQFTDYRTIKRIIDKIHSFGKKVTIVFNAHTYIEEQYPLLMEYLRILCDYGIDAVTVTNIDLLSRINSEHPDLPAHISGDAGVYNSEAVRFYKRFGIKRIILPRHLTVSEIKEIIKSNPGLEYECFIMEMRCAFEGAYCFLSHSWTQKPLCQEENKKMYYKYLPSLGRAARITPAEHLKTEDNKNRYDVWCHKDSIVQTFMSVKDRYVQQCGLCQIAELRKAGVNVLKIAARGTEPDSKFISVSMVKKVISSPLPDEKFCKSVRGNPEICDLKYMCYYR
ncbi:MAG: putative protease YhbU precursor [Elusimicrobia bacterium ADurb.Bin231]|nr:MAG: putative protease YhbU precursor [Elusimicrobia bacterium ADurb.Bin231]